MYLLDILEVLCSFPVVAIRYNLFKCHKNPCNFTFDVGIEIVIFIAKTWDSVAFPDKPRDWMLLSTF